MDPRQHVLVETLIREHEGASRRERSGMPETAILLFLPNDFGIVKVVELLWGRDLGMFSRCDMGPFVANLSPD